jgi:hypothetical protein
MASGSLELLQHTSASAVSYVDLGLTNWNTNYYHYIVRWGNVTFSNDGISFQMRVFASSTEQTGANYNQALIVETSVSEYNNALQNYDRFYVSYNNLGNSTGEVASGEFVLGNFNESSKYPMWFGNCSGTRDTGEIQTQIGGGSHYVAQANNGVKFFVSAGTMSGDFSLYGIAYS